MAASLNHSASSRIEPIETSSSRSSTRSGSFKAMRSPRHRLWDETILATVLGSFTNQPAQGGSDMRRAHDPSALYLMLEASSSGIVNVTSIRYLSPGAGVESSLL
jgi:hypothetical protein